MNHSITCRVAAAAMALVSCMSSMAYNIRGTVADSDGAPLQAATVKLLAAKDSAFVSGLKTTAKGSFSFTGVGKGKYIVEASYIGFGKALRDVEIADKSVRLDTIRMSEEGITLGEVVVTGVRTPIKVMEDTVEYTAASYKTQPNAVVEDLLKRLPGVEVDSEGKITSNGKEVTKILIEGKEFFSDDPKVASKNLPVEMIDKLQVVDRKSDLARMTGVDDGEEETVINLTVKKGMKNGWFGNVEAGYGTDKRYNGNFNINRFWNDNQITLLGNFNNINQLGFTDSNGNRFRRFGGNNGINTSQAIGLNFNVGNKEILRVGGNIMYSHSDRTSITSSEREYYLRDSTSYASTGKYAKDKGHNFRADFRVQWNPDSFNSVEFRPRFSYNMNDSYIVDSTLNRAGDAARTLVSNSFNSGNSDGKSLEFGANFIYNHKFRSKPGRSFSVNITYSHSNVREHESSFSRNLFYLLNDSIDIYDQFTDNHTWADNVGGRLTWTEPLGNARNGRFITLAYRASYRWNNADKMVYDHPIDFDEFGMPVIDYSQEIFNPDLSNRFRNDYFNQDIRIGFRQVNKVMNLEAGISFVPTMSKSIDLINSDKNIPERWVMNFAPYARYRHKFSKSRSLTFRYNGRTSQPSMTQLQPVADMSNPMNIIIGNPDLKPTFSHNVNLRFQDFDQKAQRSFMLMANATVVQNSIISKVTNNPMTGGRQTTYTNINGVWNAMLMNMISMPFHNKNWQFSNHTFVNFNRSVGFNDGTRNNNSLLRFNISPAIAFRPESLEFELRPRYGLQYTSNSIGTSSGNNKPTVHNYGGSFSAYYRTPIGVILSSDINYTATRGYAKGYNRNEWMWNASIAYELLRDRSVTVAFKAYDILHQQSSTSRSSNGNYSEDLRTNILGSYCMFTVSYRFNTFGKGKQPADRNMPGPGGPGRMHGGFGGRPPRP